jgi:hypothetical protein
MKAEILLIDFSHKQENPTDFKSVGFFAYFFSLLHFPQAEHEPEQEPPEGQPIHFLSLFLAFIMYATAPPKIIARTAIIIIFSIKTTF